MATILLSAAGAFAGSAVGGSVLGLSTAVIGRAVGATLGKVIDQRILGTGSEAVETGRIERFRLTGASEGRAVTQTYGRMRIGGEVIWATQFQETVTTSGGGKGQPSKPKTRTYSYSVSLAIAVCEGEITRIGRIWADGLEIPRDSVNLRVYTGSESQLPDSKIEAVQGAGNAPSYRGIAYVVFEDLQLEAFGNRVPQFSFEVVRAAQSDNDDPGAKSLGKLVNAVALMPGTGEYALATTPVHFQEDIGTFKSSNVNSPSGKADFSTAIEQLSEEAPACQSVSLIVSWFGSDLRCGSCELKPKVEQTANDGAPMPWTVSGVTRAVAETVPVDEGRVVYGGTPSDQSVVEAIQGLKASGKRVMFYPFILMEQMAGNGRPDPWTGAADQPSLPWRGRITTSVAPGQPGSPDQTAQARAEVASFVGAAGTGHFPVNGNTVGYIGPAEWSYRRFILHYAHLCAAAGGVDAFCIGSEMRGITRIRGEANSFPTVEALIQLAADVRAILGPQTKISYAADWSEYFGYHPQDGSGDVWFNLDPLWADPNIDFIGIDNYMPLSDWRDGVGHLDADRGAIYDLEYLKDNVAGGEGFDWYYASDADRDTQTRTPITDGGHNEPWVFRYKDLKNWWNNLHYNRVGGVREVSATAWSAQSKPFWFTELGCAAIDKGTNQPNKFLDPKSSESSTPHYSTGARDDLIQAQYLRAMADYWADLGNNPASGATGQRMVDMTNAHVWAWDARPYPHFPALGAVWSDGANYARGHWISGRLSTEALAAVVAEICERSGVMDYDVSGLYGLVRGFNADAFDSARQSLQSLMLAFGFDTVEREGMLVFQMRAGQQPVAIGVNDVARDEEIGGRVEAVRAAQAEMAGRVRLSYVDADGDFETRSTEAIFPDEESRAVSQSELTMSLTEGDALGTVDRWLTEARVARDTVRFVLPPSMARVRAGDVVDLNVDNVHGQYRIDRQENAGVLQCEASRVDLTAYSGTDRETEAVAVKPFAAPLPVAVQFLDLPLLSGDEIAHAPHIAVAGTPWPGQVAVYQGIADFGYELNTVIEAASTIGVTETPLVKAAAGQWDRGAELRVRVSGAQLVSADLEAVFAGANAMAIGDGVSQTWEIIQFAEAELVAENTYDLSMRLRGQQGTDAVAPDEWPAGSVVVLLNAAPVQIGLSAAARGMDRHYRVGPSHLGYDDPSFTHLVDAFDGIGLRPYAPVHLNARVVESGDTTVGWVRRTRIDGDNWASFDVPLNEDREAYLVQIVQSDVVVRETEVSAPVYTYAATEKAGDGVSGSYEIHVAQISARFGPGPFTRTVIND